MYDRSILLVDDEQAIVQLLQKVLTKEGFTHIDSAHSGEEALMACEKKQYDLIVLDIMMPGQSGINICPFIRKMTNAPILFLSAKSSDYDKLSGFAVGGDDYVTKPFNPLEVVARIHSLLRRSYRLPIAPEFKEKEVYDFGRFQVYPHSGELIVDQRKVVCPSLVFQLLVFLCKHPNYIFSKKELYEKVWGEEAVGEDNTVMVHIHRIRERIEVDPGKPQYLVNVRGLGYKLIKRGT